MADGLTRVTRPLARGDIVLVAFSFTDLSTTKRCPALVLWADPARTDDSSEYEMEEPEQGLGPRSVKITYRKTRQGKAAKAQRR